MPPHDIGSTVEIATVAPARKACDSLIDLRLRPMEILQVAVAPSWMTYRSQGSEQFNKRHLSSGAELPPPGRT